MTLAHSWRVDAATAYFETLKAHGMSLEILEGRILIPEGETDSELELVRLLKPELLVILDHEVRVR